MRPKTRTEEEKKAYQREYQRKLRAKLSPEEKEKRRQYQKEYYAKKKAEKESLDPPKPRMTEDEKKARKKEYNAKYWQEHREQLLEKRKTEENVERRRAYQREYKKRKYRELEGAEKEAYIARKVEYNKARRERIRESITEEDIRQAKIKKLKDQLVALGVPEIKEITWCEGKPPLNTAGISDDYMLSLADGTLAFGAYSSHSDSWSDEDGNIYGKDLPRVTAWREIPDPYTE